MMGMTAAGNLLGDIHGFFSSGHTGYPEQPTQQTLFSQVGNT